MKRIFDLIISSITLILLLPIIGIIALLIKIKIGSPVLFKQERPGLNGSSFYLYKFRSMTVERDAKGDLLPDFIRLTAFGKTLRKYSLDELPQLWNVFKGDMSFVGPRPLLVEYLHLYNIRQAKRHVVRPGITGWAQVNGRNKISWDQKFEYDVWYVENQNFFLDIKILFLTIIKVVKKEGISMDGQATTKYFTGNKMKLNIVFMGRKYWSAKALIYLIERGHNVVAIIAKKPEDELDTKSGSLYETALNYSIPIFSPKEILEAFNNNRFSGIDLVISYLYWRKVKDILLTSPKMGAINFHPGPLPDIKGLGGYNYAILKGHKEYGVTAHFMNGNIDDGRIIECRKFEIDTQFETALSLEYKSQVKMFELFKDTIIHIESGLITKESQNENKGGKYINRHEFEQMKLISELDSNEIIERKIRAFWFPPYEGAKVKINDQYYTIINQQLLNEINMILRGKNV